MIRNNLKNKIIVIGLSIMVSFSMCTNHSTQEPGTNPNECTKYACPIHPDKTSTVLEVCPQCNKWMVPIDSLKKDTLIRKNLDHK